MFQPCTASFVPILLSKIRCASFVPARAKIHLKVSFVPAAFYSALVCVVKRQGPKYNIGMLIRLNKYLASLGLFSRRRADALIDSKKVSIDGKVAGLGDKIEMGKHTIVVDGKRLVTAQANQDFEYWLLNKPRGVVSTLSDESGRKTVAHFIRGKTTARLYPVGRLDYESEGLLLMTNDGELTHRLTHPKYEISKVYKVWVNGIFAYGKVERLLRGVRLAEGKIAFDQLEVLEKNGRDILLKVTIHQGVKREIRRAVAKVGWEVTKLLRTKLGPLELLNLPIGTARKLQAQEVLALKTIVGLN